MMNRRVLFQTALAGALPAADPPRVLTIDLRQGGPYAFPPSGKAYRENPASHRVWRRVLIEAPDAIIVPGGASFGLEGAGVPVFAARPAKIQRSAAHAGQSRRLALPPREWMNQLAGQYGQELREMVYTLSFSVYGRIRAGHTAAVRPILEPFLNGTTDSLAKPTASHFSGHLALAEWYEKTNDARARDRVMAAAALAREKPLDIEMSDSVFMVCPLLAKAGQYSGDGTWFDAALSHFERMRKLCLRADGIYRHSPLDEAAWGRGNAFPLLGLALTLSSLPAAHPAFAPLSAAYKAHAAKLLALQTAGGCWRQVVDHADAWEEFTCTAMIGWAIRRGLTRQWLRGRKYETAVDRAWLAIQRRTGTGGELIDVCESTGKQKSLADYLNREAIFGKDPRGGAMALQFAAEMSGA